jgi:hypothetical protein
MNRSTNRNALVMVAGLLLLVAATTPAGGQTKSAEVRTWTGQTYQLAEPSLEVLYTIMVPKNNEGPGPSETTSSTAAKGPMLFGSASAIGDFLDKQPEPLLGNRQSEMITLRKEGAEIRLPLASIGALFFTRQPARSTLPPYVAPEHYRYSATVVLDDGSRIEADYVSLGTTFLRGRTAHGRVDIPWQHIEVVRFTR